jgi:hypothetical protein
MTQVATIQALGVDDLSMDQFAELILVSVENEITNSKHYYTINNSSKYGALLLFPNLLFKRNNFLHLWDYGSRNEFEEKRKPNHLIRLSFFQ